MTAQNDAQESNHRIANNLALVSGLLRIRATDLARREGAMAPEEAAGMLREVAARIDNVGRVHRLLSSKTFGDIAAAPYLADVCGGIAGSVATVDKVTFTSECGDLLMPAERLNTLGLFVAEALTNAFKHAHPTGVKGTVHVRVQRQGDDVQVVIQDDGVGLPEGFDHNKDGGLGFHILRSLGAQLQGVLGVDAQDFGLAVHLTAPIRQPGHGAHAIQP